MTYDISHDILALRVSMAILKKKERDFYALQQKGQYKEACEAARDLIQHAATLLHEGDQALKRATHA